MSKRGTPVASQAKERHFWLMVFETHQASGLTVKQVCQNEDLAVWSFYRWRRELGASDSSQAGPLPVKTPGGIEPGIRPPRFHQMAKVTSSCSDLQIVFPAGIHLQVHGHLFVFINKRSDRTKLLYWAPKVASSGFVDLVLQFKACQLFTVVELFL